MKENCIKCQRIEDREKKLVSWRAKGLQENKGSSYDVKPKGLGCLPLIGRVYLIIKCRTQKFERGKFLLGVMVASCQIVIDQMGGRNTRKISLGPEDIQNLLLSGIGEF